MDDIGEDPFLQQFLGTPEQRAKWMYRFKIAYILWILFVILGLLSLTLFYLLK